MRSGASAVEVLFALIVMVILLLPLVGLSQSQERESYFLEFELMAQRRCRGLIDLVLTQDLAQLERLNAAKFKPGADGLPELPVEVPQGFEALGRIERVPAATPDVATPAGGRLALFTGELALGRARIEVGDVTQLYRIRARVTWRFPGDATAVAPHVFEMTRLVGRPGLSFSILPEVR